uniref:ARAD1C02838p n=1 Tax=Blastobotrys adeninivorans TaxID=409370 RepID=A0A060SZ66_BLAAD
MALAELWSDLVDTLLPTASAEEEPESQASEVGESTEQPADKAGEAEEADAEDGAEAAEETEEAEEEEEEEEEEDDEDDEPEDPAPAMREAAAEGVCHEFKHHFEECQARVMKEMEEPGYDDKEYKEDCVEEFFHLNHCIDQQVAPVLFSKLK